MTTLPGADSKRMLDAYGVITARELVVGDATAAGAEVAATFASQPRPAGPNVVVLTTAGGWGVVIADSIFGQRDLNLLTLPQDLLTAIDRLLPPRRRGR